MQYSKYSHFKINSCKNKTFTIKDESITINTYVLYNSRVDQSLTFIDILKNFTNIIKYDMCGPAPLYSVIQKSSDNIVLHFEFKNYELEQRYLHHFKSDLASTFSEYKLDYYSNTKMVIKKEFKRIAKQINDRNDQIVAQHYDEYLINGKGTLNTPYLQFEIIPREYYEKIHKPSNFYISCSKTSYVYNKLLENGLLFVM